MHEIKCASCPRSDLAPLSHEQHPVLDLARASPRGRAYAEGGGAANGMGTFTLGTNGNGGSVTLGTTMAGIGAIVTCGTVGRVTLGMGGRTALGTTMAGMGGSVTCGTVGTVTDGMGGIRVTVSVGTAGKAGTAGRPGTALAAGAAAAGVVSTRLRAAWHVLQARRSAHAMIMANMLALEAMD
ncbi:hypothetical protein D1007_28302 [Hordeum vulgare]|nr:hypothetical protein D1007_28302 [Hordeum vulgare]